MLLNLVNGSLGNMDYMGIMVGVLTAMTLLTEGNIRGRIIRGD